MHGRVINKKLALNIALQRRLHDGLHGLVVAQADKDDVGFGHGFVDGLCYHHLVVAAVERLGQVLGHGQRPVVDDQGLGQIASFGEVLGYALCRC